MSAHQVRTRREGPLGYITLDRPGKLNALDDVMVRGLVDALARHEADEAVRVVVLHGEGRAFSAGFDLGEDYEAPEGADPLVAEMQRDFDLVMRYWDARKPVIAAVHGACLGGAFELMLACDLVVAAEGCRLGEPELKFGGGIVAMLLPWVCGLRRASEVILLGDDRLTPERARDWGIVNRVTPPEALLDTARGLAQDLARCDRRAVAHARQAMRDGYDKAGFRDAMAEGLRHGIEVERRPSEEARRFHEKVSSEGAAAAVAWLDERLGLTNDKEQR